MSADDSHVKGIETAVTVEFDSISNNDTKKAVLQNIHGMTKRFLDITEIFIRDINLLGLKNDVSCK